MVNNVRYKMEIFGYGSGVQADIQNADTLLEAHIRPDPNNAGLFTLTQYNDSSDPPTVISGLTLHDACGIYFAGQVRRNGPPSAS